MYYQKLNIDVARSALNYQQSKSDLSFYGIEQESKYLTDRAHTEEAKFRVFLLSIAYRHKITKSLD